MNAQDVIAIIMALRLSRAPASDLEGPALEREAVLAGRILAHAGKHGQAAWSALTKEWRDISVDAEKRRAYTDLQTSLGRNADGTKAEDAPVVSAGASQ